MGGLVPNKGRAVPRKGLINQVDKSMSLTAGRPNQSNPGMLSKQTVFQNTGQSRPATERAKLGPLSRGSGSGRVFSPFSRTPG